MLYLRRAGQVLVRERVQPPDVPRLCAPSSGVVQEDGLYFLQGMSMCSFSYLCIWVYRDEQEAQPTVIFTTSPDALFASYSPEQTQFKDSRLQIFFETQEMMEETMILLRFNCPDPACDYIATSGWGDLKLHVRGVHGKQMWCVVTILGGLHQDKGLTGI